MRDVFGLGSDIVLIPICALEALLVLESHHAHVLRLRQPFWVRVLESMVSGGLWEEVSSHRPCA